MKTVSLLSAFIFISLSMLAQNGNNTETQPPPPPMYDKAVSKDSVSAEPPLVIVEEMPEYPGGMTAMTKFIGDNVNYPNYEMKHNITGTCYVGFVVEKDGSVSDVKVVKGVTNGVGCDAEAVRVVKLMPRWKPGKQSGREVRVRFNLPVKFNIKNPK